MPRPPRLEFAGALYHLMSRGNGRRRILFGDDDRLRFLRQLRDNLITYDVLLYAYILMDNHYHLLVRTGSGANGVWSIRWGAKNAPIPL